MNHLPLHVIQLAECINKGVDCRFALHDALLEIGKEKSAAHLFSEGCPGIGNLDGGKGDSICIVIGLILRQPSWVLCAEANKKVATWDSFAMNMLEELY
jgi:hypothetical protein